MQGLGGKGELLAANYLVANGYKIIEKNYYNRKGYRLGEIDLIAEDPEGKTVFFEVKTRSTKGWDVVPEASVNKSKLEKIFKIAQYFLAERKLMEIEWRVDFIGVIFNLKTRRVSIRHIKYLHL
ncbi:MAG: YraN family protein [Candidatus Moranbacteria bacterium]|nr:YraN family protein [Candidatus Moranbacteria bacterium]